MSEEKTLTPDEAKDFLKKAANTATGAVKDAYESVASSIEELYNDGKSLIVDDKGNVSWEKIKTSGKDAFNSAVDTIQKEGTAIYEETTKPGGIADGIGDFFSKNKGGLLGLLGALLIGSFTGMNIVSMLLLAAAAFLGGSYLSDKDGLLNGFLNPNTTPSAAQDQTVANAKTPDLSIDTKGLGQVPVLNADGTPQHSGEASYLLRTEDGRNLGTVSGKISDDKKNFIVTRIESSDPEGKFTATFTEGGKIAVLKTFGPDGTALSDQVRGVKSNMTILPIIDGKIDFKPLGNIQELFATPPAPAAPAPAPSTDSATLDPASTEPTASTVKYIAGNEAELTINKNRRQEAYIFISGKDEKGEEVRFRVQGNIEQNGDVKWTTITPVSVKNSVASGATINIADVAGNWNPDIIVNSDNFRAERGYSVSGRITKDTVQELLNIAGGNKGITPENTISALAERSGVRGAFPYQESGPDFNKAAENKKVPLEQALNNGKMV